MNNILKYIFVFLLLICLILVRAFQTDLFYDPFIVYFKNDYLHLPFPEYKFGKLFLSFVFRYLINFIISVGIIYLLFQKKYLKFSVKFYAIAFLVLLVLFFIALQFTDNYLFLFYVRRFLIQPLFVLVLIPAFYYQNRSS